MKATWSARTGLGLLLVVTLIAGAVLVFRTGAAAGGRLHLTAYFASSNGIFVGDDVRVLGVPVGKIERIEPQPTRVKIDLSVDAAYKVPADANAAILAPTLVTARAVQLIPAYTSGPEMADHDVIPQNRTVVPVEWDDVRTQLQRIVETLQPTEPGGVSSLGAVINTAADNLRGQGINIRDTIVKLSQTLSILNDHSTDVFATVKNLSVLVSALHDSAGVLEQLNQNLASVTALLADDPNEVGTAMIDFNRAAHDVADFVAANRETVGVTTEKLSSISQAVTQSLDDIKQALHVFPTTLANFDNIYQPAQGGFGGIAAFNMFSNPIQFMCSSIQAASRLNAEQSAKLCVQYLAPIFKNRQYNFLPFGTTIGLGAPLPVVAATARPNEITYSEDWMRPDYVPPQQPVAPQEATPGPTLPPLAAEVPSASGADGAAIQTDPQAGLPGMMVPAGPGS